MYLARCRCTAIRFEAIKLNDDNNAVGEWPCAWTLRTVELVGSSIVAPQLTPRFRIIGGLV